MPLNERLGGWDAFADCLLFSGFDGREDALEGFLGPCFAPAFCVGRSLSVLLFFVFGNMSVVFVGACAGADTLVLPFDRRGCASGDALRALSASSLRFFIGGEVITGRSSSSLSLSEASAGLCVFDAFSFFHATPFAFIVFCFARLAFIFACLAC